jgi:hypothetical protein
MAVPLMPLPWLLPGIVLALAVSLAASGRVGDQLGVPRRLAAALVLSIGVILAATVTPHVGSEAVPGTCRITRIGPAPLREYRHLNDTTLNVLLFIPLGATVALLPRNRARTALIAGAVALPFVVETIQLAITWLDRSCEGDDVFDNLTGLVVGFAIGAVAERIRRA